VVRAELDAALDAAFDFVGSLPRTGSTGTDPLWFSRLLERPLRRVAQLAPAGAPVPELVSRTLDLLQPLRTADLPLVFEHGDLGHPNLLLTHDGRLAAVDWERSEPYGLPGHDFSFFLQYVAESRRNVFDRRGQRCAFDEAFTGHQAWARPILERHLADLDVDRSLLPLLTVASWARSSAGLVARLTPAPDDVTDTARGQTTQKPDLLAALEEDRDFALWRHSVLRYGDLLR
jgi:hypothetical protein